MRLTEPPVGAMRTRAKKGLVKAAWTEEIRAVIQRGKKDALSGVGSRDRGAVQLKANMKRKATGSADRLDIRWVEKEMN